MKKAIKALALIFFGITLVTSSSTYATSVQLEETSTRCSKSRVQPNSCGECSVNGKPGYYSGSTCLRCPTNPQKAKKGEVKVNNNNP